MNLTAAASSLVLTFLAATQLFAGSWPQFRGANGSGRAESNAKLPTEIGPETNVLWKAELPPGHSSPIVVADRIFLTGVRENRLLTIALDRKTGKLLWEAEAPHEKLEEIHRIGSYAQPSAASDGRRVVSFFGSSGLYCYDMEGTKLWSRPMGPFKNDFGAGTSPIIVDGRVILCQDHDLDSFLEAFDVNTGETLWRTDRSEFSRNYCSPVIWNVNDQRQIVVAASLNVIGYDFETGKELWRVPGVSRVVCMTPVVGDDNRLFVAGWSAGGDPGEEISLEPFDDYARAHDKNNDGLFVEDELPKGPVLQRFSQIDRNKDLKIDRAEYDEMRMLFDKSRNVVMALEPSLATSEAPRVQWEFQKFIPFCSSPLFYNGHLFLVKDGGICTSLDGRTGEPVKTARLPGTGNYYASAVAGDGKVYYLNQDGKLTVTTADGQWSVLHTADFKEDGYGTPAIVDGRIYLRTSGHLYCFGTK